MARPLRINAPGLLYHLMARGNARMPLYLDDYDCGHFLEILASVSSRYGLQCWAYALMPNHYHLVARTTAANLSLSMRQLNGVYAQWWNRRHGRVGHVTQGRFKAQVVQQQLYAVAVCRYVLLNPVRAKLVDDPAEWRWSSCAATLGKCVVPPWLASRILLEQFGPGSHRVRQARLAAVLRDPPAMEVDCDVRGDCRVIGDLPFIQAFHAQASVAPREVPRRERHIGRPSLRDILGLQRGRSLQAQVLDALDHAYTLADVAAALGLHRESVRRLVVAARREPVRIVQTET